MKFRYSRAGAAAPSARRTNAVLGLLVALAGLNCLAGNAAQGQDFVPFVIPARIDPQETIWIADWEPIATDSQRLTADKRFLHDGKPVRIWGMNLCFGANFPTHEDAPHVATRLAAAGVNSVRCHHMDTSRWPRGIWNAKDGKTIEPEALDRLDYFINELAKCGIWVNINLHVGRTHSQYLDLPKTNSDYDKVIGIFTPALIDAQKQYARELLTRVNPYRKVRYADDPAVAFVEITNEDSFFMWDGEDRLRELPPYYAGILRNQFNSWLQQRYHSDEALAAAWGEDVERLSEDMVYNGRFIVWDSGKNVPRHWNLEQHENCRAVLSHPSSLPRDAMQIDVAKVDDTGWHLQLTQGELEIVEGRYYTLSFEAAAKAKRQISCGVSQAHAPWSNLGLSRSVDLGTEWQTFKLGFTATSADENARISFAFGGDTTPFYLARVELRPGGQVGLAETESASAGNVELFTHNESTARTRDRMVFLAETEKSYFDDMRAYIKNDLGCGALVTGTIVFGPLGLFAQSDMDFIDAHAYWQHPRFPGRPWDQGNWTIEQKPMTDHPEQATLFRLAAERLLDKPFTVSEYNHPAPLDA
ncbi:MAG: carbohydrate binding domain-containing protein, partial [Sedimentisphaerales bacterium]|nr:carbohydrate binding domain-containing protein [Sedimentisphaerales bacterium]